MIDIQYHQSLDYRYTILIDSKTISEEYLNPISCNFIINSAWENIEYLNSKLGITYINGTRSNRLKCLLEVSLPDSLRDAHSVFLYGFILYVFQYGKWKRNDDTCRSDKYGCQ